MKMADDLSMAKRIKDGCSSISIPKHWRDDWHERDGIGKTAGDWSDELARRMQSIDKAGTVRDDVTGEELDANLVKAARATEMEYFRSKKVYFKVPRSQVCGKIIRVRWVSTNKGDSSSPNYRSMPVAMEFQTNSNWTSSYDSACAAHMQKRDALNSQEGLEI